MRRRPARQCRTKASGLGLLEAPQEGSTKFFEKCTARQSHGNRATVTPSRPRARPSVAGSSIIIAYGTYTYACLDFARSSLLVIHTYSEGNAPVAPGIPSPPVLLLPLGHPRARRQYQQPPATVCGANGDRSVRRFAGECNITPPSFCFRGIFTLVAHTVVHAHALTPALTVHRPASAARPHTYNHIQPRPTDRTCRHQTPPPHHHAYRAARMQLRPAKAAAPSDGIYMYCAVAGAGFPTAAAACMGLTRRA